jgi:hypothetical protein
VVDRGDIGVVHPGQRAGLAQHPLAQFRRRLGVGIGQVRVRRADFLERDLAVQGGVAGPPHQAHAPAAQSFQQFEAAVDQSSAGVARRHGGYRTGGRGHGLTDLARVRTPATR